MTTGDWNWELDRTRFSAVWRALGARDESAFAVLRARYAEPHRAYHTAEHIHECMIWHEATKRLAHHPDELGAALYFHDVVYVPAALDNEAQSAELFRHLAALAGVVGPPVDRVCRLIEATATHRPDTADCALMCDIDLSILGASPARYARFEEQIQREHAAFDDGLYRDGRARVLSGFLDRAAIYTTPYMAGALEQHARSNLERRVRSLGEKGAA